MKVFWYKCAGGAGNFGDELTPLFLDYFDIPFTWASQNEADMFGIGSVLQLVPQDFDGIIWSTGVINVDLCHGFRNANILAVRGKLTLEQVGVLDNQGICLGDGGLLCSLFAKPVRKKYNLGIILHYTDYNNATILELVSQVKGSTVINICEEAKNVIQKVNECENIISSSLHGLILADSLNIPNHWIGFKGFKSNVLGSGFKFLDYYSNFGIKNILPFELDITDTLDTILPKLDGYERSGIDQIKEGLLNSLHKVAGNCGYRNWKVLSENIIQREKAILSKLDNNDFPLVLDYEDSINKKNISTRVVENVQPLQRVVPTIRASEQKMGKFCVECLRLLIKLHNRGIVHRDIRIDNIAIYHDVPIFKNFGWAISKPFNLSSQFVDDKLTSQISNIYCRDIKSLGKVFREINNGHYLIIEQIIKLMVNPDAKLRLSNLGTLVSLFEAAVVLEQSKGYDLNDFKIDDSKNIISHLDISLIRDISELLGQLNARDKCINKLKNENALMKTELYSITRDLALYEINNILTHNDKLVLVDGNYWVFNENTNIVPFLESNGEYWGEPLDDEEAIRELERMRQSGANYFAIGNSAFWWTKYYPNFYTYLNSNFLKIRDNDRLIVYDLHSFV